MSDSLLPKLLIVEDDAMTYHNLVSFFKSKEFPVVELENGGIIDSYETALEIAAQEKPDIALLDIELNGERNGLQLGKKLSDLYGMPILFLTGHDTPENNKIAMGISTIPLFSKVSKIEDNVMILKSLELLHHRYIVPANDKPYTKIALQLGVVSDNPFDLKEMEDEVSKRKFDWRNVRFICSYNKKANANANNHLVLHMEKHVAYRIHAKLYVLLETELPDYFEKISRSVIINMRHITRKDFANKKVAINGFTLDITREEAIKNIEAYLNKRFGE